jgi:hypothetical protein
MRKGTLLLSVLVAASLATTADAATKKKAAPAPLQPYTMDQSRAFIRDAMFPLAIQPAAAVKPVSHRAKRVRAKAKKA